jgi:tRNA pseudouridine13 synthase
MKIKQQPEDFQVEELTDVTPGKDGPFAFYRLEKRGWTTPDAVQAIRRRWQLDRRRVAYGGLKDRHAHTVQYLTIFHGPQRNLTHQRLTLTFLGHVAEEYGSASIRGNRFRITIRALSDAALSAAQRALEEVRRQGVPNYFDDQRFGSVGPHGEFMAQALVAGQYEEALRRALAAPYEFDRGGQKKEKALLRSHWGEWAACKAVLPRGHARSLVDYLVQHPQDFRGTLERLRPDLRGLYLSAYQSHLWNRMLARWLRAHVAPEQLIFLRLRVAELPVHWDLDEAQLAELAQLRLPLPSARVELDDADPRRQVYDAILMEEGLRQEQFRLKGMREMFFSRGDRATLCRPANLAHESGPDELNPKRQKLIFGCELPRGSYATLIVKRMTSEPPAGASGRNKEKD